MHRSKEAQETPWKVHQRQQSAKGASSHETEPSTTRLLSTQSLEQFSHLDMDDLNKLVNMLGMCVSLEARRISLCAPSGARIDGPWRIYLYGMRSALNI